MSDQGPVFDRKTKQGLIVLAAMALAAICTCGAFAAIGRWAGWF